MSDFLAYLDLLRSNWAYGLPSAATTTVAIIAALTGKRIGLPTTAWLAITVAGVIAAQYLVWRDGRHMPIDEKHAEALRLEAHSLTSDRWADAPIDPFMAKMFQAHFPKIVALDAETRSALTSQQVAARALSDHLHRRARQDFSEDIGWKVHNIADAAEWFFVRGGSGLHHVERLDIEVAPGRDVIWWNQGPVWRGGPETPGEAEQRLQELRTWVAGMCRSEAAEAVRAAHESYVALNTRRRSSLEPIVNRRVIARADRCPVCGDARSDNS